MNRVERGSGMNKEHFIIELKIYLKALNPKDQAIILAKYKALRKAKQKNKWQNHWGNHGLSQKKF